MNDVVPSDFLASDFLDTEIGLALLDELQMLESRGLQTAVHYNMALYIAWKRHPKEVRAACELPVQLNDFCATIGISTSSVRQWRLVHTWLEAYIKRRSVAGRSILDAYKDDVFHALGQSASNPKPQHAGDRRTFLQLTDELDGDGATINNVNTNDPYSRIMAKLSEPLEGNEPK